MNTKCLFSDVDRRSERRSRSHSKDSLAKEIERVARRVTMEEIKSRDGKTWNQVKSLSLKNFGFTRNIVDGESLPVRLQSRTRSSS